MSTSAASRRIALLIFPSTVQLLFLLMMKLPSSVSLSLYFLFFLFFFCFKSVNAFIYRLSCCCCCCCCCLVRIPHDVSSRMFIIRMCLLPVDDLWRPIPRRFRRTLISRSSASAIVAVAASMASCARPESITIQLKISQLIELIHSWNGRNQQLWGGGTTSVDFISTLRLNHVQLIN